VTVQLITATATSQVDPRWLARRVAMGLWHQGYFGARSDVDASLSDDELPSVSITFPDACSGQREFLITVEEL
jgi:hypothetical protein